MKKFNNFRSFFLAATVAVSSLAFTSCDNDDNDVEPEVPVEARGPYDQKGVFIINEGNWGIPNGSIAFLSDSANHKVINNIFTKANADRPLGDVVMDMDIVDSLAYITVNSSNKIEVVNAYTFRTEAVLENLKQPRYFVALNGNKGYVTETISYGAPGQVSVIDLKTMMVTKTIPVGVQPEELVIVGDRLYVANSGGNSITVINTTNDTKLNDIAVTAGPSELELDNNGNLWVLSTGVKYTANNTPGALSTINLSNGTVTKTLPFNNPEGSVDNFTANGDRDVLYYNYDGKTYSHNVSSSTLSTNPLINRSFYGLGIDPSNGYIYGGDDNSFRSDGTVYIYKSDGTPVTSFTAGIGPNGFVFN